jgi:hypothetical protein
MAALLLLSACRSHKGKEGEDVAIPVDSVITVTPAPWQDGDVATTTGRVTMTYNGRRATLNTHVRLKRGDVIQVQFTYSMIITIQVGSMELTRDEFLFLDRVNRQYVRAPYAEVDGFLSREIDFENVQSMFWGDKDGCMPQELHLSLPISGKTLKAHFTFDEWGHDTGWQTRTQFNESRFNKVTLEQLVQTLINM